MTVFLIDDDATLRSMMLQAFELDGLAAEALADPLQAVERLQSSFEGVVVTDVRMPGIDGFELFRRVRAIDPEIPVIMMTGHGDVAMVIDALKRGVFDFIPKPFSADHLLASVRRALECRSLIIENRALRAANGDSGEPLIGETPVMVRLRETIRQLARADVDVLIEGETGTGKELAALLLHKGGPRRSRPFIAVNCAALPAGLAEGELFGYAPGSHPIHRGGQAGRIEASERGTLFLDEAGSMSAAVQGALLRVLEEREVQALGAERPKPVDLRVVAATNVNLSAAVERGEFRKDLYYRLNHVQLRLPPLRERPTDIPILFAHFAREASDRLNCALPEFSRDVLSYLVSHSWPGNVRELRSFTQRVLLGLHAPQSPSDDHGDLVTQMAGFEAGIIRRTLTQTQGDVSEAISRLGLARNTFYDKLKKHGIRAVDYRSSSVGL